MNLRGFRSFLESTGLHSVYMDSSAWNSFHDDRVRKEADAVERILDLASHRQIRLVFSQALREENPKAAEVASQVSVDFIKTDDNVHKRARRLHAKGLEVYEAIHVACAEEAGADVLITTNDRLIKKADSLGLRVRPETPTGWLSKTGLGKRAAALAS